MPLQLDLEETILNPPNSSSAIRPTTWLAPVILLTLRESTSYGYKLMEQTAAFGFGAMNAGTLYRTLRHMESDGLCESEWDTTNEEGPVRRVYSITDAGEAYLDFWVEALKQYQLTLDAFFGLYMGGLRGSSGRKDE